MPGRGLDAAYLVTDTASDGRWLRWAPQAAQAGACSVLCLRLTHSHHPLGSLNLYATAPGAFDHTDVAMGSIYARHAAAALSVAKDYSGLRTALLSRQIIGAAQGTLSNATACPWTRPSRCWCGTPRTTM